MTHRDMCHAAAQWLLQLGWCDLVAWELTYGKGVADVLGLGTKTNKVAVIEVKRTRADLLADLRQKKMLRYETGSTYCYLYASKDCFLKDPLEELQSLGLPLHWGVLVDGVLIRSPRQIKAQMKTRVQSLIKKIAKSHMWREINAINATKVQQSITDPSS